MEFTLRVHVQRRVQQSGFSQNSLYMQQKFGKRSTEHAPSVYTQKFTFQVFKIEQAQEIG